MFPDDAARRAHLVGGVGKALTEKGPELLREPPSIEYVDVLASELPQYVTDYVFSLRLPSSQPSTFEESDDTDGFEGTE
ncbi:hypothetical protein ACFV2U_36680 [Streptomyces sp. NPDC059697]|uniref:hypothetical protein n=1 Tax=Streptomyces sp. NPDC059697 TaxID=3346912 RepID=UPI00369BD334